jgi:hypothetical protein
VPLKVTVGLTLALSLTVRVAPLGPAAAGVKNTETVQLEAEARVFGVRGQVVVVL